MKIIFDSKDERKKFITKVQGCPSNYGLESNCDLSCVDCWSNALVGISEIKQDVPTQDRQEQDKDVPIPNREEQHNNDLIFAKRILKARIMCGERETSAQCSGDCDGCRLYESGTYAEMIHAYQIAIQCIEREERLRKWLTDSVKATTSA